MSNNCISCGASLAVGQAFCVSCGARQDRPSAVQSGPRFCNGCGTPLATGSLFCTGCGARVGFSSTADPADKSVSVSRSREEVAIVGVQAPANITVGAVPHHAAQNVAVADPSHDADVVEPRASAVASPNARAAGPTVPSTTNKGPQAKILIAVLGVFALILTGVMGSCLYVGYRVKKKAEQIQAAYKSGDVHKLAGSVGANRAVAGKSNNSPETASPASPVANLPLEVIPDFVLSGHGFSASADTVPAEPEAATGDRIHDWALKYERTTGGPEADLVVRTGDINNLGFGWPNDFDPFSGNSTPMHPWPTKTPVDEPQGTDRIMIGSGVSPIYLQLERVEDKQKEVEYAYKGQPQAVYRQVNPPANNWSSPPEGDGYTDMMFSQCTQPQRRHAPLIPAWVLRECTPERQVTMPMPILLSVGAYRFEIHSVLFQIFLDDFQAPRVHSHFQVSLNGTRIPSFEDAINSLDQSGPVGKLVSLDLLPEYWPLLQSGTVKLLIDDPTTHARDGYAIDFVRVLFNPYKLKYQVTLQASVFDADKHTAITGATVAAGLTSAITDKSGQCTLRELPAGLVTAVASAPGYDAQSIPVDIAAGQTGTAQFQLLRHQEDTANLEKSIAETGSVTLYGIHFDTDSAKLRADSGPTLAALLELMKNHPDSHWVVSGHTDNQGESDHNQKLSEARAASVVAWLKDHSIAPDRLLPQGFGATRPVADNATADGRALNRR